MQDIRQYLRLVLEGKLETQALEDDSPGTIGPTGNLALYINSSRHNTIYVLYNPDYYAAKMRKEVEKAYGKFKEIKLKGDKFDSFENFYNFSNVQEVFRDSSKIYGYIVVNMGRSMGIDGTCNDANEVRSISARRGYGTLMYLVAMVNDKPLMPNRDSEGSSSFRFWEFFNSQKAKMQIDQFSDETKLHPKDSDDCAVYGERSLDQSYALKKDYNLGTLQGRHGQFIHDMEQYFTNNKIDFVKSRVQEYILDAGKNFHKIEAVKEEEE